MCDRSNHAGVRLFATWRTKFVVDPRWNVWLQAFDLFDEAG